MVEEAHPFGFYGAAFMLRCLEFCVVTVDESRHGITLDGCDGAEGAVVPALGDTGVSEPCDLCIELVAGLDVAEGADARCTVAGGSGEAIEEGSHGVTVYQILRLRNAISGKYIDFCY